MSRGGEVESGKRQASQDGLGTDKLARREEDSDRLWPVTHRR